MRDNLIVLVLLFIAFAVMMAGCTTAVTNSCLIPEALDYRADGPAPLIAHNLKQHFLEEAHERAAHAKAAADFNSLHDYVKAQCQ